MDESEEKSIKKCLGNIHGVFDAGQKCLGVDWRINFQEEELKDFVTGLPIKKREQLSSLVAFFAFRMLPLSKLNEKDDTINDALGPDAWSDFALIIIMSILEKYTKGDYKRKNFIDFVSENLPITSKEQLIKLSKEHSEKEPPPSIKRLATFFRKNLEKGEIDKIIKNYMAEKQSTGDIKITTLEEVVQHLHGEVRSGFIHDTGVESIYNESTFFKMSHLKPDTLIVYSNLSMSNLLFLSWKAIFRDLGYSGEMNSKYTEEEIRNKMTVDGTRI